MALSGAPRTAAAAAAPIYVSDGDGDTVPADLQGFRALLSRMGGSLVAVTKVTDHVYELKVRVQGKLYVMRVDTHNKTVKMYEQGYQSKKTGAIVSIAVAGATMVGGLGAAKFGPKKNPSFFFLVSAFMQTTGQVGEGVHGIFNAKGEWEINLAGADSQFWQQLEQDLDRLAQEYDRLSAPGQS
ncbi:hypothetical protein [Limnobacter sp.]|jgi:hypothetical protein|uniref:hypothetical protein n=1 Tax=Limnobacter sp. TaxID=2003368 RepID=UPI001E496C49|nr:hypothetical protein [Nostoc sp. CHAB 5844]